jgi:hypothetical protein
MAVMARENWTDERLDYFEKGIGERFDGVKVEFTRLEKRMDERFDRMDERFAMVDAEFTRVDKRFQRIETQMTAGFARTDADIRELRQALNRGIGIMVTGFLALAGLIVSAQIFF